jgi:membrane-associated PAP2 superfamily phosphatase
MSADAALAQRSSAPMAWRWRQREWNWIALAWSVPCLLFSLWPALDLQVSAWAWHPGQGFVGNRHWLVLASYEAVPWLGRMLGLAGLLLALLPRRSRRLLGARWHGRLMALALVVWLGVGLLVNGVFKEHWGRPRPVAVQALGGTMPFQPALRPSLKCTHNCSFVSGHAATGFALMAVGLVGPPATRRRWLWIGGVAGLAVGAGRVAQGGHFLSDVVLSGVLMWACCAAVRLGLLSWRWRRLRRP